MPGFSITDILSPCKPASAKTHRVATNDAWTEQGDLLRKEYDTSDADSTSSGTSSPSPNPFTTSSPLTLCEPILPCAYRHNPLQPSLVQESRSLPWTLFASSAVHTSSLTSRECLLRMSFEDPHLNASFPHELRELRAAYDREVLRLRTESHLSFDSNLPWMETPASSHYLLQHLSLIERIERSLSLLRSTMLLQSPSVAGNFPVRSSEARTRPSRRTLSQRAVRIMENWYQSHEEHPYPSYEACQVMAEAGEISTEQVKKWFANRRLRRRNTKSLSEIARRRKVSSPMHDLSNSSWRVGGQL